MMIVLFRVSTFCKVLASVVLVYSFLMRELIVISLILAGLMIVWIFINSFKYSWISNIGFVIYLFLSGLGLMLGLQSYLILSVVVLSLAAWDVDDFNKRLLLSQNIFNVDQIVKKHMILLVIVIVVGILTIFLSTLINIKLDFEISMVLAVLAVLGLLLGIRSTLEN